MTEQELLHHYTEFLSDNGYLRDNVEEVLDAYWSTNG